MNPRYIIIGEFACGYRIHDTNESLTPCVRVLTRVGVGPGASDISNGPAAPLWKVQESKAITITSTHTLYLEPVFVPHIASAILLHVCCDDPGVLPEDSVLDIVYHASDQSWRGEPDSHTSHKSMPVLNTI